MTKTLHLRVALLADSLADADEAFQTIGERLLRGLPAVDHHMIYGQKVAKIAACEMTVTP